MKRRDFIKTGTAVGTTVALGTLGSGCSSSDAKEESQIVKKNIHTTMKHNHEITPASYYESLTNEEKVYVDGILPDFELSTVAHHLKTDKLYVANPGASRVMGDSNLRSVSDSTVYEVDATVKSASYTIHMYYKKIDGDYVSYDSKFANAYQHRNIPQDKDDVVEGNLPKYKLSYLVLVVPDGSDDDETIIIDNPIREIVKSLLYRTTQFSHFSQDDMKYALSLFDNIFTAKTKLETMINHAGMDSWFRYDIHRDNDGTIAVRKTQTLDDDGNVIHDIGDVIYTYPMRDIFAESFKSDLKVLMDFFSADDRIAPLLLPQQEEVSRMARWRSTLQQRSTKYNDHTYKVDSSALHSVGGGIELESVDSDGVNLLISNHYNRHLAVSHLEIDYDEKPYIEDSVITHNKTLPPRYALLSIPIGDSKAHITVPFADRASGTRIYFSSWSFIDGSHRTLYYKKNGDKNDLQAQKDILLEPELLTGVFELALPAALIAWGGLHITSDASWKMLMATSGFNFAKDIAAPIVGKADLSASEAMNAIVGPLVTHIIQGQGEIVKHIVQDMAESDTESSVPIAGTIYRGICLAANVSNLAQAIYALSTAKAIEYVDIKRYHTLTINIRSDADDHSFPNDLTQIDIFVTYKSGVTAKHHKFDWDSSHVVAHTVDGGGSYSTYEVELEDQPAGGEMTVDISLKRDTWVAAHISSKQESYTNDAIEIEVKNNLISLTGNSFYQHYAKLTNANDGAGYKWNVKEQNKLLESPKLSDAILSQNQLFSISVNDPIGAIGYSYRSLETNKYNVKNISAVLETPNQGLKSYESEEMIQVSYNLLSHKSNEGSVIFEKKDGLTYIREININSESNDFEINFSQNVGTFITDTVTQFGYYQPEDIIAGLDTDSGVLHIIHRSKEVIADSNKSRYENVKSAPATIKINKETDPKTQYLYNPKLLTMSPVGEIIILEETKSGEVRLRAFDRYGRVDLAYTGFNNETGVFKLKTESLKVTYLDISIEAKGYIYVLKYLGSDPTNTENYFLDIYNPQEKNPNEPMVSTPGMSGGKIVVDYWRSVYTLNYETNALNEPTVSLWIPPVG